MALARKPSRRTAALIAALPCAGLLTLAASCPAHAFTPAEAPGGTAGSQFGPYANPFPDAGTAASPNGAGQAAPVQPPDYRYQGTLPLVMGGLPAPGFTIVPELTVQEAFNDNILQSETDRRWDLITLLTPGLTIGANTPRLNLSLYYAPTGEIYARTPSQDSIAHQLLGVGSVVLVPDTLYMNARAFAAVTPTNGGYAGLGYGSSFGAGASVASLNSYGYGAGTAALSRANTTQVYGASITPYLVHRFGEFGTGTVGVDLSQTNTSDTLAGGSENATTEDVNAQFQSGSYFGRVQDTLSADVSRTQGTGVLNNEQEESVKNRVGYALFRQLQVFGDLGYEDIRYSGSTPYQTKGAIWRAGATFTPNPSSQVTLSYGHEQGITGFSAQANYALTERTTLTASYTQEVTTYLQQVAAGYGQAGLSQSGAPINAATGLPLTAVNGALAVQNTVYRNDIFYLGLTVLLDRDTLAFDVDYTDQTPVSAGGIAQRSTTGTASWTRALSERATASASLSYGTTTAVGLTGDSTLYAAAARYNYALSPTLTTSASYVFFDRISTEPGFSMYENIILLTVTKRF